MDRPTSGALVAVSLLLVAACGPGGGNGATQCADLLPGDLVITEVLASSTLDDRGNEWWEFYNATDQGIDLEGVVLFYSREDGEGVRRHTMRQVFIQPGQYFVVGNVDDEFKPAHVDYGYGNAIQLRNDGAVLALECNGVEIDSIVYPPARTGESYQFTGSLVPDHIVNNDPSNWCETTMTFGSGADLGTPGQPNEICPRSDECIDDDTSRPTVAPTRGDLVITEVLPASSGFNNDRNWFEVFVVNDVDLNGLVVGRTTSSGTRQTTALNAVECLHFPAGSHVLFARRDDADLNGGLPQVDFTVGFTLVDSNGNLFLEFEGEVLDEITWTSSRPRTSLALDPDKIDPDENDDEENWKDCDAPYGDGMFGTPGAPNALCDLEGLCLDNSTPRAIVPPQAGQLVITEIMARPDPNVTSRKWIEVTVIGSQDFDLNGLTVLRVGGPERTIEQADCARVSPGDRIVFAHTDVATLNGGLPVVDHIINFTSMLNVSGTNTIVLRHGGDDLESMTYSASQVPLAEAGRALALDPARTTPEESSDPANWCLATTPYGDGDPQNFGTPGAVNDDCAPSE